MESVVVYCGANKGNHPAFEQAARELGRKLSKEGVTAVYGGGSVGLMGVLADEMIACKGTVLGVITKQLNDLEVGHKQITQMTVVETMAERKTILLEGTDGVITMPGGYGSMDELFEALCAAQLHLYHKPIGLLNTLGFYDPLVAMLDNMVQYGFLKAENRSLCIIESDIDTLLERMQAYEYDPIPKWM